VSDPRWSERKCVTVTGDRPLEYRVGSSENVMRYQGKITSWKDDQGFGFITPNGGGEQVFLHIKTFSNRQRRPVGNEIVTYELTTDERQRPRAVNVAFVGERRTERSTAGSGWGPAAFVILFLACVAGAIFTGKLPIAVVVVYLGASAVAFTAYAFDKSAAKKDQWRTKESTLHLFGLIGGWPGALLAQRVFRHKSRKREFQTVFWATVVLNCGALAVYSSPTVSRALLSILGAGR
jgi:uncharacterized membrane protein YsdA (DUF1294 family)/cold shock CspA family protein